MYSWSDAAPAISLFCLVVGTFVLLTSGVAVTLAATPTGLVGEDTAFSSGVADSHPSTADTPERLETTALSNDSTGISVNTSIVISLDTEGNARWTITETFNTTTETQQRAFQDIAVDFEAGDVSGYELGLDAFVEASQRVDAETARDMRITDSQRRSTLDNDTGQLRLSFTWENFARIQDGDVILDDVYETEQGLWFQRLSASQDLTIKSPDEYGFAEFTVSESTSLENRQLKIEGPVTLTNETLQAVLVGNSGAADGTADDGTPQEPTPNDSGSAVFGPVGLVIGGFGLLAMVVVVSVFAVGRERLVTLIQKPSQGENEETDVEETVQPDGTTVSKEPPDTGESEIDMELLSDEERVERLLDQNGGRMKQANIVKETGWSNAKVSQLLSSMEDEDRINKLRIGRENLISFPEEDVTEISDE